MKQLRITFAIALSLLVGSTASAMPIFDYRQFVHFLDAPDGLFWNDVSGALQFCDQEELRASFHMRLAVKKYGRKWVSLTASERAYVNHFIGFGTGVARGLAISHTSSSTKQEICDGAEAAAKAYIAAEA